MIRASVFALLLLCQLINMPAYASTMAKAGSSSSDSIKVTLKIESTLQIHNLDTIAIHRSQDGGLSGTENLCIQQRGHEQFRVSIEPDFGSQPAGDAPYDISFNQLSSSTTSCERNNASLRVGIPEGRAQALASSVFAGQLYLVVAPE